MKKIVSILIMICLLTVFVGCNPDFSLGDGKNDGEISGIVGENGESEGENNTDVGNGGETEDENTENDNEGPANSGESNTNYGDNTTEGGGNDANSGDNTTEGGENDGISGDNTTEGGENNGISGDNTTEGGENSGNSGDNTSEGGGNGGISGDNTTEGGENDGISGDNTIEGGENSGNSGDNTTEGGGNGGISGDNTTEEQKPVYVVGNAIGNLFRSITLEKNGGGTVSPDDYRGKIVIVNIWATWCPPCKAELPDFDRIAKEYADDVVIIAAHDSYGRENAPAYIQTNLPDSSIIFAYDSVYGDAFNAAGGTKYVPRTAILDRNGVIIYAQDGLMTYEQLKSIIERAI